MSGVLGNTVHPLLPFSALNKLADEPILTGPLLYLLTRAPDHIRQRLLQPLRNNLLAKNGASRLKTAISVIKVFFIVGLVRRISHALDRLSLNGWALRRQGEPFAFGPAKQELVVITGGSSGFGYEMVKAFSKVARVVAFDVNACPPELEKLPDVHFYRVDISDYEAVEEVCADVRRAHGDPTVLINNAGIANKKTILATTNEETERLFKINIITHFTLIREFVPGMLRMRKGHIVTIASMASFGVAPGLVDYACTKVGALFLNDGLRVELSRTYPNGECICTTSVHPSWYQTGILAGAEDALAKQGIKPRAPVEVADRVFEQVVKGRSGRLVVPASAEKWTSIRSYPLWMQDAIARLGRSKGKSRFQIAEGKATRSEPGASDS